MKVLLFNHHYYLHEIADYRWTGTVLKGLADQQFLLVVYFIPVFPIAHFHLGGNPRCTRFMFQVNLKKRASPFCCELCFLSMLTAPSTSDTGTQHPECLGQYPPCGCRWEPAHSETHAPAPACTSPVRPSPLEPSAAYCTGGKGLLPLLFKLNHKVTYSNKSEVIFQNVNSINLALASRLLFCNISKIDLSIFTAIYLLVYPTNAKESTNFIT